MHYKTTTITVFILIILILSLMLSGCGSRNTQNPDNEKSTVQTRKATVDESEVEKTLAGQIADGKLVEVYDEYVRVKPGGSEKNWMIINNVKDNSEQFQITPCAGCDFATKTINVPAGEYRIVQFNVRALEGQTEIKVKDHLNNAYGYAQISIIVDWS